METWIWKELTRQTGVGKISDGGNSICESKDTMEKKNKRHNGTEYLGTGEYGTCILSELGDFSRKQRGTEITGIGTIPSLTS